MAGIDSYTKLMLHMNSDFSDSSDSDHTPTVNGATIDTTIKQFGAGSGKFVAASSQYVTYPSHADWDFGSGDFTIDFWTRFDSTGTQYLLSHHEQSVADSWYILLASSQLTFGHYPSGSETISQSWAPSTGTWYHVAIVVSSGELYHFIGGTQVGTEQPVSAISTSSIALGIGASNDGLIEHNGHIDELRISKGIARWTSNFTPPSSEYSSDIVTPDMWHPEIQQPYKEKIEITAY